MGKKPFIDQRFRLYVKSGGEDLIDLHLKTRQTFRVSTGGEHATRDDGLDTLRKYRRISFAVPRLTGTNPDYITMAELLSDPHWRFQRLGAATSVFYLFDSQDGCGTAGVSPRRSRISRRRHFSRMLIYPFAYRLACRPFGLRALLAGGKVKNSPLNHWKVNT